VEERDDIVLCSFADLDISSSTVIGDGYVRFQEQKGSSVTSLLLPHRDNGDYRFGRTIRIRHIPYILLGGRFGHVA
jgi:hypothetical protein